MVKEYIKSEIKDLLELEENKKFEDVGFIIFMRKASCGKMTEGGWKEAACTIELFENYQKNYDLKLLENIKILNLPIYMENEAIKLFNKREIVEFEVKGAVVKELKIKDAPMVDLGDCRVKIPMD
ncbi:MAG: hypothetical protein GF329_04295 [Candidatus Lokiarchaeota archaeon]|nr:hypothetical protein [Candidatus Lokiarchaeota archaeon]